MYQIFDGETENRPYYGRFASPWHPDNFMVAHGWKNQGDKICSYSYQSTKEQEHSWSIPDDCTLLVGHNLRFDLTWIWEDESFIRFIERGGQIWCTQYAEYLLEGHDEEFHMNKLEDISVKYGGTRKVDAVKAMWEDGFLTSEIPKDLLIDYLIGTKEEGYNGGDIGNTERIFLAQIQRAKELGMTKIIEARMDGYLATTEMEYNGINVDVGVAFKDMVSQQQTISELHTSLNALVPDVGIPKQVKFNWSSSQQVSAVLFGGYVKYEWSDYYIDEETGERARAQVDVEHAYLENHTKENPSLCDLNDLIDDPMSDELYGQCGTQVLRIKSGKKKGAIKTKKVKLKLGNLKKKRFEKIVKFDRQVVPLPEWTINNTDALDRPVYSTGADTIDCLIHEDNELASLFAQYKRLVKVVDTYYLKVTSKTNREKETVITKKGLLTFVKPNSIINHYLNHTNTVTGRMSAKSPNFQNIPRGDTAIVKQMFTSRWGDTGVCIEADYSQLEVVVNGYLTKDKNLLRDLTAGVDFHCKRVALKNHIGYDEAFDMCKVQKLDEWISERTKCKSYTFSAEYGAGDASIAKKTGMTIEEVKSIRAAEELEYPVKKAFTDNLKKKIEAEAFPFRIKFPHGGYKSIMKGYYTAPTGTRYSFRSEDAPSWLRAKGVDQTFKPTKIMNYPTQGTGGEIMQVQVGVTFRACVAKGWWSGNKDAKALLVNTVHDCVWGDCHQDVHQEFGNLIKTNLESVPSIYNKLFNIDVGVDFPVDVEYGRDMMHLSHELNQ